MNCSKIPSLLFVAGCALVTLLPACSTHSPATTGTETNWLKRCVSDADCGAYACYCGVCSASCNEASDCDHESVMGSCQASADIANCTRDVPQRLCVREDEPPRDAAVTTNDVDAASAQSTLGAPSTTDGNSSGGGNTLEQPVFAYAAVPCERRAPSQCYQGDECYAIFAWEVDGNERVVGCTPYPNGEGSTCAIDPFEQVYLVGGNVLPEGWTNAPSDTCEPECFSPWRNLDEAGSPDTPGCPCTAEGSVCIEGVGFECFDATDDLRDDRIWQVTSRPCDEEPDCSGGFRLTECLARYAICAPSGVVLDTDQFTYCGDALLPCASRTEAACNDDCEAVYGTANDQQVFGGCLNAGTLAACGNDAEPHCVQRLTPQTSVPALGNQPVLIEVCEVPAGFGLLEPAACEEATLPSSCAGRDADACTEPCFPRLGRRSPGAAGEFIVCDYTACVASRTICGEDAAGTHVEFFGCLAPGWTQVNSTNCDD